MASPLILPFGRGLDRQASNREIAQFLWDRYKGRGVLERSWRVLPTGRKLAVTFIVALNDPDDQYAPHNLDGELAVCEWWQRNNTLCGLGIASDHSEADAQALSAARRPTLERLGATVWYERPCQTNGFRGEYRMFRRGRRRPPDFRPRSPEITAAMIARWL